MTKTYSLLRIVYNKPKARIARFGPSWGRE